MLNFAIGINMHVGNPVLFVQRMDEDGRWPLSKTPLNAFTQREVLDFILAFLKPNSHTVFFVTTDPHEVVFLRDERARFTVMQDTMRRAVLPPDKPGCMEIEMYDEANRIVFTECVRF